MSLPADAMSMGSQDDSDPESFSDVLDTNSRIVVQCDGKDTSATVKVIRPQSSDRPLTKDFTTSIVIECDQSASIRPNDIICYAGGILVSPENELAALELALTKMNVSAMSHQDLLKTANNGLKGLITNKRVETMIPHFGTVEINKKPRVVIMSTNLMNMLKGKVADQKKEAEAKKAENAAKKAETAAKKAENAAKRAADHAPKPSKATKRLKFPDVDIDPPVIASDKSPGTLPPVASPMKITQPVAPFPQSDAVTVTLSVTAASVNQAISKIVQAASSATA